MINPSKNKRKLYTVTITKGDNPVTKYTKLTLPNVREVILVPLGYDLKKSKGDSISAMINTAKEHNLTVTIQVEEEQCPKLLEPTDTWQPQRKHMKDLFIGFFRQKYGKMPDFEDIYNAGIDLLRDSGQPVYLKYLSNWMEMNRKKYHPEFIIDYDLRPRFYSVSYTAECISPDEQRTKNEIMTFSDAIKMFPNLTAILESPDFDGLRMHDTDGNELIINVSHQVSASFDSLKELQMK